MRSIERRALVAVVLSVLVGLSAMAIVATRSIASAIEREFDGLLKDVASNIAASSDFTSAGEFVLTRVPDQEEFDRQRSGWYWMVTADDTVLSRSRSLWTERLKVDDLSTQSIASVNGPSGEALRVSILPAQAGQPPRPIKVVVSAPAANVQNDIRNAVVQLGIILSMVGALTVAAVAIVLRRALSPLSHSAIEVEQLTNGAIARLSTTGYREVDPLVKAVNELMASTRNIVEQSRLGSANLAHALRTPLTALRTRLALVGQSDAGVLEDVARIEGQIDYHLRRVRRVVGAPIASTRVPVRAVADDVSLVVRKSHRDRRIAIVVDVPDDLTFRGEREDLEELLCILVDNAMKWATARVGLVAKQHENKLVIMVQDDGPGIAEERRAFVLQPGNRLDESIPGTGLGLFIAREIVSIYAGRIEFGDSASGGLLVSVEFQPS